MPTHSFIRPWLDLCGLSPQSSHSTTVDSRCPSGLRRPTHSAADSPSKGKDPLVASITAGCVRILPLPLAASLPPLHRQRRPAGALIRAPWPFLLSAAYHLTSIPLPTPLLLSSGCIGPGIACDAPTNDDHLPALSLRLDPRDPRLRRKLTASSKASGRVGLPAFRLRYPQAAHSRWATSRADPTTGLHPCISGTRIDVRIRSELHLLRPTAVDDANECLLQ